MIDDNISSYFDTVVNGGICDVFNSNSNHVIYEWKDRVATTITVMPCEIVAFNIFARVVASQC